MSDVHIHLHIPPGYQLAFVDGRMTIGPIAPVESAREPAHLRATPNTFRNGVSISIPAEFTAKLRSMGESVRGEVIKALRSAPRKKRARKRSKPRA